MGWDDSYPASNFATTPPGNGALLVRNSWGTSWGQGGYFWLSYYDSVCPTESVAFYGVEPTTNYTRIYQYDPLGWTAISASTTRPPGSPTRSPRSPRAR